MPLPQFIQHSSRHPTGGLSTHLFNQPVFSSTSTSLPAYYQLSNLRKQTSPNMLHVIKHKLKCLLKISQIPLITATIYSHEPNPSQLSLLFLDEETQNLRTCPQIVSGEAKTGPRSVWLQNPWFSHKIQLFCQLSWALKKTGSFNLISQICITMTIKNILSRNSLRTESSIVQSE